MARVMTSLTADADGVEIEYTTSGGTHMHLGDGSTAWSADNVFKKMTERAYQDGRFSVLNEILTTLPATGSLVSLVRTDTEIAIISPPEDLAGIATKKVLFSIDEVSGGGTLDMGILQVGWYQDEKADMFYYEGENHWKNVDLATNKKLTKDAQDGKLEHIS